MFDPVAEEQDTTGGYGSTGFDGRRRGASRSRAGVVAMGEAGTRASGERFQEEIRRSADGDEEIVGAPEVDFGGRWSKNCEFG